MQREVQTGVGQLAEEKAEKVSTKVRRHAPNMVPTPLLWVSTKVRRHARTLFTCNPARSRPATLNPLNPHSFHLQPSTHHPSPLNPQPATLNPHPFALDPRPSTLNPRPAPLNL
eukprot:6778724-Prymnesium_polylepis.1